MCFRIDLYTATCAVDTFLYCKAVVKTLYRACDQTFCTSPITTIASAFMLVVLYWCWFGINFTKFSLNAFNINRRNMVYFGRGFISICYVALIIFAHNYVFHKEVVIHDTIYMDCVVIACRVQAAIHLNGALAGQHTTVYDDVWTLWTVNS